MLHAKQDSKVIQRVKIMILRTRAQQGGTGVFYHTDLRRDAFVPIDENDWYNPRLNSGAQGLSSNIGGTFSQIPNGSRLSHLYSIVGTVVETPQILVPLVEGDELVPINPNGLVCTFEMLAEDVLQIQEQNQMFLNLEANCFVQFNAQDYGEGFDEDGRDRAILRGSLWARPQWWRVDVEVPELKSAAASREEVLDIAEVAKAKNEQRALSARAQSWANRAERDEQRARDKMPPRRGTNTSVQIYGGPHYGVGNQGVPYGAGTHPKQ